MPEGFFKARDNARAIVCLKAATHIEPDGWWRWYNLAAAFARAGDASAAFQNLRKSFDLGFRDAAQLTGDPDFASLRSTPEFQGFVSRVSQAPPA